MPVVVTSLGMVSSVGLDVITACASIRAGLRRPKVVSQFMVDSGEFEEAPLTAYPVSPFADGFTGSGKWLRLAVECLRDLVRYGNLPDIQHPGFWQRTALIATGPYLNDDRYGWADDTDGTVLHGTYLHPLLDAMQWPLSKPLCSMVCRAHAAFAHAVLRATQHIEQKQVDRIVILGADSYIDTETVRWLQEHHRLKDGASPSGLIPGEACAAILLEDEALAWQRGARIEARLGHVEVAQEDCEFNGDKVGSGAKLTECIVSVAKQTAQQPFVGDLHLDLNGERWKSAWWGNAQIQMQRHVDFNRGRLIFSGESLGETGAASGVAAICCAVRSFQRRYASGNTSLICGLSDHGEIGALAMASA